MNAGSEFWKIGPGSFPEERSSWQRLLAHKMQVQIRHVPSVEEDTELFDPLLSRKVPRFEDQQTRKVFRLGRQLGNGDRELLRNEEEVRYVFGMNVFDGEDFIIFVDDGRGQFAIEDFMEDRAFTHEP